MSLLVWCRMRINSCRNPLWKVCCGRDDPNSGAASFSVTLGPAPHLDMHYTGTDSPSDLLRTACVLLNGYVCHLPPTCQDAVSCATVFGEVTGGWATLDEFEKQPTKTEGIFVMPEEPIIIQSTYVYNVGTGADSDNGSCEVRLAKLQTRFNSLAEELQHIRAGKLPG